MIGVSGHNYSSMALTGASIQNTMDTSIQRLSSGQRINAAKDDVAGMQISMRLKGEIRSLEQATINASNAQSLLDAAEGAISQSVSLLQRVRELALQSANGTNSSQDRTILQKEVQQLLKENDRIANQTSLGGVQLLDGTFN